jgi:hypothetical protein
MIPDFLLLKMVVEDVLEDSELLRVVLIHHQAAKTGLLLSGLMTVNGNVVILRDSFRLSTILTEKSVTTLILLFMTLTMTGSNVNH